MIKNIENELISIILVSFKKMIASHYIPWNFESWVAKKGSFYRHKEIKLTFI